MAQCTKHLCLLSMTKFLRRNVLLRFMFILLIAVSLLYMHKYYNPTDPPDLSYCFIEENPLEEPSGDLQRLEDVLLAERQPMKGKSIFFHETGCYKPMDDKSSGADRAVRSKVRLLQLTTRQACAIESAALHNPNFDVFVLFASVVYTDNSTAHQPLLAALFSYPNVHMRNSNVRTYMGNTPVHELVKSGVIFKSRHVVVHLSDCLRYVTLWRYGGTYMDMDVVVKQSLMEMPPNYSGSESIINIAAGVMNFAPDGFGAEVAELCLQDLLMNFDGTNWGGSGPGVISRVLRRICGTRNVQRMNSVRCRGFRVYPKEIFYAIHWTKWRNFFEEKYVNETLKNTDRSLVVHVWNKYSKVRPVKVGSNVAYGILAAKHCPKVYAACGEYF